MSIKSELEQTTFNTKDRKSAISGLKRAAKCLQKVGWGRGADDIYSKNKLVGHCLMGALNAVEASDTSVLALGVYLSRQGQKSARREPEPSSYERCLSRSTGLVNKFNDARTQTRGGVLRLIRKTIKALETKKI